jgi:hypothetical protein
MALPVELLKGLRIVFPAGITTWATIIDRFPEVILTLLRFTITAHWYTR